MARETCEVSSLRLQPGHREAPSRANAIRSTPWAVAQAGHRKVTSTGARKAKSGSTLERRRGQI
jgi:hypothetical protein